MGAVVAATPNRRIEPTPARYTDFAALNRGSCAIRWPNHDDRMMKHTIYKNVKCEGDLLTLRTSGLEGTVTVRLSTVRKVKITFPSITIEADEGVYRLDLTHVEPSEYAQAKALLTYAMKANKQMQPIAGKLGSG